MSLTHLIMHIPKTGGSSILNHMLRCMRRKQVQVYYAKASRREVWNSYSPRQRATFKLVQGHFTYGIDKTIEGDTIYHTCLREPVDRVISHFHYHIRKGGDWAERMIKEDMSYVVWMARIGTPDQQTRFLVDKLTGPINSIDLDLAKHRLSKMGVVGFTDHMQKYLDALCIKMILPTTTVDHTNVSPDRPDGVDEGVRRELTRMNEYDTDLFNWARDRFLTVDPA